MLKVHEVELRVRYQETDAMGLLHHANYLTYFEVGRTELLRASGRAYRQMEEAGLFMVVVEVRCRYRRPVRYDDVLRLRTIVAKVTAAKVEHDYQLYRGDQLVAEGHSVLACVDKNGELVRMPEFLIQD
jgi:acyl-CoA thioester hydrolase